MQGDNNMTQNIITSAIYEGLFGADRDEMIAEAKLIAGDDWNYIGWRDDDNALRDWLTGEALEALSAVESSYSRKLNRMPPGRLTYVQLLAIAQFTVKQYAVKHGIVETVWQESNNDQ